jgi:hypothetical protein
VLFYASETKYLAANLQSTRRTAMADRIETYDDEEDTLDMEHPEPAYQRGPMIYTDSCHCRFRKNERARVRASKDQISRIKARDQGIFERCRKRQVLYLFVSFSWTLLVHP